MNRETIKIARRLAFEAGFNPDQLVVRVEPRKDKPFLKHGCAPVDIQKILPVFMIFYAEAEAEYLEESKTLCE